MEKRVQAGVAVFVYNLDGQFLVMKRKGAHGAGTWGLPGGHIEFGETVWQAAEREVKEEIGIDISIRSFRRAGWSEAYFEVEQKHYITTVCAALTLSHDKAKIIEPDRCDELRWVTVETLPIPLFLPLKNYLIENKAPRHG